MVENTVKNNKIQDGNQEDLKIEVFYKYKIGLIGDSLVGKTTLTHRLEFDYYKPDTKRTIGMDFSTKIFMINNKPISVTIWDFSGESRFRDSLHRWIRGSSGLVFMYDITNIDSLFHINDWLSIVYKTLGKNIPIAMVGGKNDLQECRKVTYNIGKSIADFYKIRIFYECSSVSGENVKKIFKELAKTIYYKNKIDDYRRESEKEKEKKEFRF